MNLSRSVQALVALATLALVAACGGGGSSGPGPIQTPFPTATPTGSPTLSPTPTPVPTGTIPPGAITQSVVIGQPLNFPTVNGYGGNVQFNSGTPSTGVTITQWTSTSAPSGYPASLPSSAGSGAGAVVVAPWLTFFLSQSLTLNSLGDLGLFIQVPSFNPSALYYAGVFDLTGNSLIGSVQLNFSPTGQTRVRLHDLLSSRTLHRGGRASSSGFTFNGNDRYYIGLFQAGGVVPTPTPSGTPVGVSTTEPITPGTTNFFPVVNGDGGGIQFPAGSTPANDPVTLTTAITLPPGYPTSIPTGSPGFGTVPVSPWLTFQLGEPLSIPGAVSIGSCGASNPSGTYYLALFDITLGGEFLQSLPVGSVPPSCGSNAARSLSRLLTRGHPRSSGVISTDLYYIGTFYQAP